MIDISHLFTAVRNVLGIKMQVVIDEDIPILGRVLHKVSLRLYHKFGHRTIRRKVVYIEGSTITVDKPFPKRIGRRYVIEKPNKSQ